MRTPPSPEPGGETPSWKAATLGEAGLRIQISNFLGNSLTARQLGTSAIVQGALCFMLKQVVLSGVLGQVGTFLLSS